MIGILVSFSDFDREVCDQCFELNMLIALIERAELDIGSECTAYW
jgi:hypothetical protein